MSDRVRIKGGATEFEAAVIAVVIDQHEREAKKARQRAAESKPSLSRWVRAARPDESNHPHDPWKQTL
jgi:hypothetical protein